ncbi:glycosyltransferase family 4 protein [Haloarcula japonica]|uniref:Hexosyltransferase n=1 Tax=Haloarcula japonica (strain ATCC 49778 / DSM 6131 / JCM 7785 / NBRC 101032 / NCIMB 13157 / TR-1) TaxID=1227453 RepID=M0LA73_HALJT|nr:glycosyltransferase family 4 protein [Haloarcula japonica]EMA30476.1 hexosyltransferase [Haloarcula japonica DSM 6131]
MSDSLRVCLLSKQFPPGVGGAETYAYELANGLGERGHDVDVYTQWVDSPDEEVDVHENVSVYRICGARRKLVTFETLWFSYTARRKIDFEAYDIVHGTMMPASTIAVTAFDDIRTPVVLTSHGTSIGEAKAVALETPADYLLKYFFHPMNVVMDYVASRAADKVIAISDHAYEQLTTSYRLSEDGVEMIPHGVDTDRFYPRQERHPAADSENMSLLYIGRLGARKGLALALRALARVESDGVEFLIAGTGRHEDRLRKLAQELEIQEQVRFLGYVDEADLPELYSSADVFILPSKYEGFGLVLLEAIACGTPVIGADAGGIPTAVDDGVDGCVVERNEDSLADTIEEMIQDDQMREEMKISIQERESRSWDRVIQKTEHVYSAFTRARTEEKA